ncbi:S-layer homology domain-containing protein [Demequina sp. NBRC 110053]|uniref:S-layer homology domain-containing protein n=1 Tax=Demequina sp. NBRC 110053 TaxID=1570342 RepID=UPI000A05698F|nr:S-layer homology domain-containing protein [Demequina sp. NBRC 110053]
MTGSHAALRAPRRWAALALIAALAIGSIVADARPSRAADPLDTEVVLEFADVFEDTPFAREMTWLANEGVSTGWVVDGEREYRPLRSITRDAMAAFLYRLAGSPDVNLPAQSPFVDVTPASSDFYKEIVWLSQQEISTGWDTPRGKAFKPLSPITRDAMAAFLYRYAEVPGWSAPSQSPFADVTTTSSQFYDEITWLASSGISAGWVTSRGSEYRPLSPITRDAMAAFLYRFEARVAQASEEEEVVLAPEATVLEDAEALGAIVTPGALTLTEESQVDAKPNDVVVAGVTPSTPEGLLVRVTAVTHLADGSRRLETEQATVADAIVATDGAVTVTGQFTGDGVPEPMASARMARAASAETSVDVLRVSATFEREIAVDGELTLADTAATTATLNGEGSVKLESHGTVGLSARATIEIVPSINPVKQLSVSLRPDVAVDTTATVSGEVSGEMKHVFARLSPQVTFMVGPVPVVVTTAASLSGSASFTGEAAVEVRAEYSTYADYGFAYADGRFTLLDGDPVTVGPDVSVKASASIGVRASIDVDASVKLYGLVGFTAGFGPYATAEIAVDGDAISGEVSWDCPAQLGLQGRVGLVAGIELWGMKLGSQWEPDPIVVDVALGAGVNYCEGRQPELPTGGDWPLRVGPQALAAAAVGHGYSERLYVSGGIPPYVVEVQGLPEGLAADDDGTIVGTPATPGRFDLAVVVADADGKTRSGSVSLVVEDSFGSRAPVLVSSDVQGLSAQVNAGEFAASADGRYVAMVQPRARHHDGKHATDVVVKDRWTGDFEVVSAVAGDGYTAYPSARAGRVAMSADGRYVAYSSSAGDLLATYPTGVNRAGDNLYVHDRATDSVRVVDWTQVAPADSCGLSPERRSVALSADGTTLLFSLECSVSGHQTGRLLLYDMESVTVRDLTPGEPGSVVDLSISDDGAWGALSTRTGDLADAYLVRTGSGAAQSVLDAPHDVSAHNIEPWALVTPDGSAVVYQTRVPNRGVDRPGVHYREIESGSARFLWTEGYHDSGSAIMSISQDSTAAVVVTGQTWFGNTFAKRLLYIDFTSGTAVTLSADGGASPLAPSQIPAVFTRDGTHVMFTTSAQYAPSDSDEDTGAGSLSDIYEVALPASP